MGVRNHRDRAEGKRIKRRMPSKDEIKMGTRIHQQEEYEEEIPEVYPCDDCGTYTEEDDLEINNSLYLCPSCRKGNE